MMRFCSLLLAASFVPAANAAEMLSIEVDYDDGKYTMTSEVWFGASVEQVFEVFSRWDYSVDFSSAIVEARDVEADALGRPQFYIRNKGCILFFCKSFERRGYVETHPNELLLAFTDPDNSDFHLSDERWDFLAKDDGTVVTYNLKMEPKFWMPPGIGPYLLKRKLKKDGGGAIDRIETIAQGIHPGINREISQGRGSD